MNLSIITVNKNNAAGLERTIQSVINQTFKDFEYIIIDGASTDSSVEVIKKYANKIDYWISEPDRGIYNAMNKGIKVAKGEYLLFLNSGDWLVDDKVLEEVFSIGFEEDIVYGDLLIDEKEIKYYPDKITLLYFFRDTLPHPGSLIKKEVFNYTGLFNENFVIASDYDFFLKALIKYNVSYLHLKTVITVFLTNGISSKNYDIALKEKKEILKLNFPRIYDDYINLLEIKRKYELITNAKLLKPILKFYNSKIFLWLKQLLTKH